MPSPNPPPQRIISIPNDKNALQENLNKKQSTWTEKLSIYFPQNFRSFQEIRLENVSDFCVLSRQPPLFSLLGIFTETKHEIAGCDED